MSEPDSLPSRTASVSRTTGETDLSATVNLDGEGTSEISTGIGFLDHMLDLLATHGRFDLTVDCTGDLEVDAHHSIEDTAIVLGQAFRKAVADKAYINRYGHAYVPMDETLARAVIDLSGRFYLTFDAAFTTDRLGDMPTEMVRHFWYSFAEQLQCNLHVNVLYGANNHHMVEATFKAVARALDIATTRHTAQAHTPSTKGTLD
jgi:imidazoleglycerol-phosphate dehydratase